MFLQASSRDEQFASSPQFSLLLWLYTEELLCERMFEVTEVTEVGEGMFGADRVLHCFHPVFAFTPLSFLALSTGRPCL
jgi:hypothetical protein